jgi:hypothetical protein
MMHAEGAVHVTTERSVLGATLMALDHVPTGPTVVVVVDALARVVVEPAPDAFGPLLWLHPAARKASATTAARDAVIDPERLTQVWAGRPLASRAR